MSIERERASERTRAIFSAAWGMNACPPKPGLTDMIRTRSTRSSTASRVSTDVPGLSAIPALLPRERIALNPGTSVETLEAVLDLVDLRSEEHTSELQSLR